MNDNGREALGYLKYVQEQHKGGSMSKMSELDRQRQEVEEIVKQREIVGNPEIVIQAYYSIDSETGIIHYDTDSIREEFEEAIKQLESNEQAELDGWNEKQQDYAMDNMTSDVAQEVVNYE